MIKIIIDFYFEYYVFICIYHIYRSLNFSITFIIALRILYHSDQGGCIPMKCVVYLLIVAALTSVCLAQTGGLNGRIVNADNMQPLIGVNVIVMNTPRGSAMWKRLGLSWLTV